MNLSDYDSSDGPGNHAAVRAAGTSPSEMGGAGLQAGSDAVDVVRILNIKPGAAVCQDDGFDRVHRGVELIITVVSGPQVGQ